MVLMLMVSSSLQDLLGIILICLLTVFYIFAFSPLDCFTGPVSASGRLCYHTRPMFLDSSLLFQTCKHLILHRAPACYCYLYSAMIVPRKDK